MHFKDLKFDFLGFEIHFDLKSAQFFDLSTNVDFLKARFASKPFTNQILWFTPHKMLPVVCAMRPQDLVLQIQFFCQDWAFLAFKLLKA